MPWCLPGYIRQCLLLGKRWRPKKDQHEATSSIDNTCNGHGLPRPYPTIEANPLPLQKPRKLAEQYGDNNSQYNQFSGKQKIVEGNYYEARGNQNFDCVPPK